MHGIKEYNLTEEIIRAHIDTEYQRTEKIYHRSRLTLQSIYDAVLKKYYPNGLWVYGEKDIEEFRLHIKNIPPVPKVLIFRLHLVPHIFLKKIMEILCYQKIIVL